MSSRRSLVAMIHVAKKDLGLDEDGYRDVLVRVTGKSSASEMTIAELGLVVDDLRKRGFTPTSAKKPQSKNPHVRKLWAVWGELGREGVLRDSSRGACRAFVKRMTKVEDPEWLTPHQVNVCVEALKAWKRRDASKRSGSPVEDMGE